MKKLVLALALVIYAAGAFAQGAPGESSAMDARKKHRIVFQLASSDTAVHMALIRQLNNVLAATSGTEIEVVTHGPGISMMVAKKAHFAKQINELHHRGVHFMVCENTLNVKMMEKTEILQEAGFVPVGIMEIVYKQEAGWSYIKAGF
jgi:uncharacterized protein